MCYEYIVGEFFMMLSYFYISREAYTPEPLFDDVHGCVTAASSYKRTYSRTYINYSKQHISLKMNFKP